MLISNSDLNISRKSTFGSTLKISKRNECLIPEVEKFKEFIKNDGKDFILELTPPFSIAPKTFESIAKIAGKNRFRPFSSPANNETPPSLKALVKEASKGVYFPKSSLNLKVSHVNNQLIGEKHLKNVSFDSLCNAFQSIIKNN